MTNRYFVVLCCCLGIWSACTQEQLSKVGANASTAIHTQINVAQPNIIDANGLTYKAYKTFAQQLAITINERNPDFFNQQFALSAIVNNIVQSVQAPQNIADNFVHNMTTAVNAGEEIVNALGESGQYTFLHINQLENKKIRAIFRLSEDSDINYHEVYLASTTDADIIITDFYIYKGGLPFSETLKKLYLTSLVDVQDELDYSTTSSADKAFIESVGLIHEINGLYQIGDYQEAYNGIAALPQALQNDKMVLMLQLKVAQALGNPQRKQALQQFKKYYPNDPAIAFLQLDHAFANEDYGAILTLLDGIDLYIGGDAHLKMLQANTYVLLQQHDIATSILAGLIAQKTTNEDVYWQLLQIYLKEESYVQATALLTQMQNELTINPVPRLVSAGIYNQFLNSSIYKDWMMTQKTLNTQKNIATPKP